MSIPVKLEAFEGPLDLLLHLIDKNKVNIYDIPIAEITRQYLDYIKGLEKEDLDTVSEFLVMAATLIEIKSKMLLPKEIDEETSEEKDPREELVKRLLEYKMCKYAAGELRDRQFDAAKALYKKPTIPDEVAAYKAPVDVDALLSGVTLGKLNDILSEVLKRSEERIDPVRSKFGKIEKEEVNIEAQTKVVMARLTAGKKTSFRKLLGSAGTKMQVVVTFLIILELMKTGVVSVVQNNLFDDIEIELNNESGVDIRKELEDAYR